MNAITYDTHAAVKRLIANGFKDSQAEALVYEICAACNIRLVPPKKPPASAEDCQYSTTIGPVHSK